MIDITYLDNSGFIADTPTAILVFDYYKDPAHSLEKTLKKNPNKGVIFFVSHSHYDHFNPDIFNLAQNHQRQFVISNEVQLQRSRHDDAPIAWVSPGDNLESLIGNIKVTAFGSTDAGVSYLVTLPDGKTIFHAGDLNYWHWQDESTVEEIKHAYNAFVHEMQKIMSHIKELYICFFPVDPRMGSDFAHGAQLFMENISVKYFFPMHFRQEYKEACDFDQYTTDQTTSFCLHTPGESISLR